MSYLGVLKVLQAVFVEIMLKNLFLRGRNIKNFPPLEMPQIWPNTANHRGNCERKCPPRMNWDGAFVRFQNFFQMDQWESKPLDHTH
jgi:hypothetical protein